MAFGKAKDVTEFSQSGAESMSPETTKLIIIHYHLRPGGVRRIIELATPHVVKGRVAQVILVTGEAADKPWFNEFCEAVAPVPVSVIVEKSFRYVSEQKSSPKTIRSALESAMNRLFAGATPNSTIVWAHNLGIGRNLLLTDTLTRACAERQIPLLAHHHDWWFDNRWRAWREMRACGFRTRGQIAQTLFYNSPSVRHLTINSSDASSLQGRLPGVAWLPNLTEPVPKPSAINVERARAWVRKNYTTGDAPLWLVPARLLRRKNIAEALLLTRWLRSEAVLLTTAGVSSAEEMHYAERLKIALQRYKWPLRLGILQNAGRNAPTLPELLAASEAILLTSVQEGFGLPFIEAASAGRPLIARTIPNIMPDLDKFGFRFPQLYEDILIAPELFDWNAERAAQERLFQSWRKRLPQSCRKWAGEPVLLQHGDHPVPVPFSRLTLKAQLEILAQPRTVSFEVCAELNPFLRIWQERAEAGKLQSSAWPKAADNWLSGSNYAKRFWQAVEPKDRGGISTNIEVVQDDFIRQKLVSDNLFPLLMARET